MDEKQVAEGAAKMMEKLREAFQPMADWFNEHGEELSETLSKMGYKPAMTSAVYVEREVVEAIRSHDSEYDHETSSVMVEWELSQKQAEEFLRKVRQSWMAAFSTAPRDDGFRFVAYTDNRIPRRAQIDHMTTAEKSIRKAVEEVELMGANPKLTEAVVHLSKAFELIADYTDIKGEWS